MQVDPYILAFSAVTVIATVVMGFWSAKKSKGAGDFFVAGRSVSVGWNASAISGEYLSAASFMGIAGMVMSSGYDALWYPVCYACGYLFLLLFIAGPLRRFGAYTIPDFAEGRFDSPVFRKIAVVFVLCIGFFYTMPQMKGAGTTLSYIFPGLPYWAGVALVGAVITCNVALGGMKGITLVQAVQYWLKMFAISVPIFVLMAVYGNYNEQIRANNSDGKSFASNSAALIRDKTLGDASYTLSGEPAKPASVWRSVLCLFSPFNTGRVFQGTDCNLKEIAEAYLYHLVKSHEYNIYVANELNPTDPSKTLKTVPAPSKMSGFDYGRYLRSLLATNGISVVHFRSNIVAFMPVNQAEYYHLYSQSVSREPLPEKAPADAAWLNPFGPLTTKAATAAQKIVKAPSNLTKLATSTVGERGLQDVERRFRDALEPLRIKGWTNSTTAETAFSTLAYCTVRAELTNPRSDYSMRYHSDLADIEVPLPKDGERTYAEWIPTLNEALSKAGVTILREPGNKFLAFPTRLGVKQDVNVRAYSLLYTYSLIIALVCGTAGLPHILVRFYTNPDGVAAKRTTMWVMILIGVFYVFPPIFGVMGRNLFPELYLGVGSRGTDKIVLELPRLLNERYGTLGSILSGITCAGAFAAFMSTFSGLLVSMTGALAHDVYGRMLRPASTAEQRMKAFKYCAVLVGVVSVLLGSQVEQLQINFMVGQAFAIAAASYFPLLFMSVWWRGITTKGAATGMLTGGVLALVGITLTSFSDLKWIDLAAFWAAHPLLRILCEQPAIWAVPAAITLMYVVSKATASEVPKDIRMKMLVLHAPEQLGLKQEYIQEHSGH